MKFQKGEPICDLEKRKTVPDTLEEKLGAIERGSGNVEVQWNNINKCVLDIMSDLVGNADGKASTQ
jgi:hypothetical protein